MIVKKIYLAGPDVFRISPVEHFEQMKKICLKNGFVGLSPFDSEIDTLDPKLTRFESSRLIYTANLDLIKQSDIVLANISPFRGPSVDPGTAFEMGYAKALGKETVAYSGETNTTYKQRIHIDSGLLYLMQTKLPKIEDFGLTDNLMIAHSSEKIFDSFEEAIEFLRVSHNKKVA